MSVMIEGVVARGVVTGGHPAFQRAHSTMCYPSLDTPLRWSGAARSAPESFPDQKGLSAVTMSAVTKSKPGCSSCDSV